MSQKRLDATRQARLRFALLQQLAEDGDERRRERRVGDEGADQVRHLERDREGVDLPGGAEVVGGDDLADEPEDPGEPGGEREDRRRPREPAARLLVHAREYREGGERRQVAAEGVLSGFGTISAPADRGPFHAMPNIKQQKKRVRTAAKQRLENLRYRSTAKTLAKRLEAAVAGRRREAGRGRAPRARPLARPRRGPGRAAPEHGGAPQGAGRPARLSRQALARPHGAASRGRVMSISARSSSRSTGEPRAALDRVVERGQPDDRFAQLVRTVVARLREELLDVERMPLQPRRRLARAQPLLGEQLAVAHPADVADEQAESDGTVRETGSPERSSSVWQAVSAAARSRLPHASVSS